MYKEDCSDMKLGETEMLQWRQVKSYGNIPDDNTRLTTSMLL